MRLVQANQNERGIECDRIGVEAERRFVRFHSAVGIRHELQRHHVAIHLAVHGNLVIRRIHANLSQAKQVGSDLSTGAGRVGAMWGNRIFGGGGVCASADAAASTLMTAMIPMDSRMVIYCGCWGRGWEPSPESG